LPVCYAARPCRRFRSWDKFVVALQFGRIRYHLGAPIFVSDDTQGIEAIETAMNIQVARLEAEVESA
jgi:lysophospholipid acyltransferase (LPLAT)-like uncharacterized protein